MSVNNMRKTLKNQVVTQLDLPTPKLTAAKMPLKDAMASMEKRTVQYKIPTVERRPLVRDSKISRGITHQGFTSTLKPVEKGDIKKVVNKA